MTEDNNQEGSILNETRDMQQAKPICVIYFPQDMVAGGSDRHWIYEYMGFLNGEPSDSGKTKWDSRKDYWNQYYWFCFYKDDITAPEFQVLNAKDISPTEIEELRQMVNDAVEKIKTPTPNHKDY